MNKDTFKKVIYFDFTGTLFDPFVNIRNILNHVSKRHGFKYFNESELSTIKKMPPIPLLNTFLVPDEDKKTIVKEVLLELENEIEAILPVPGIQDMLHPLIRENYYLGILSNNSLINIKKWLTNNNINIFHDITCIQFQENKTPYLQKAKEDFSLSNSFYFISDEVKDLKQAHEAGFSPIGVSWGFDTTSSLKESNPALILSNPNDLLSFIFEDTTV